MSQKINDQSYKLPHEMMMHDLLVPYYPWRPWNFLVRWKNRLGGPSERWLPTKKFPLPPTTISWRATDKGLPDGHLYPGATSVRPVVTYRNNNAQICQTK